MNYIVYHLKLPSEFEANGEELYSQVFSEGFLVESLADGRILFSGYRKITGSGEKPEDKRYDKYWLKLNSYLKTGDFSFTLMRELYSEKNWIDNWRENYQPVKVEDDWIILPPWKTDEVKSNSRKKIIIDPGQAFGTGSHESTYLALANLTGLNKETKLKSMLDIGTGSGILAIGGKMLGIEQVMAIDISDVAIENCINNLEYNNLSEEIDTIAGDIGQFELKKFELVISNLLAPLIHGNFKDIINKVTNNGFLILSGYIDKQSEEIKERLIDNGFDIIKEIDKNEWRSLIARRSDGNAKILS